MGCVFFFSSRRRHTRLRRDWSSDVCSSDLDIDAVVFGEPLLIADKDQLRSKSVDDVWLAGENMVGILPRSGEIINALVATGQTLIVGSPLARNGSGLLKLATTPSTVGATSEEIACFSDEAITTTATTLVRVRAA